MISEAKLRAALEVGDEVSPTTLAEMAVRALAFIEAQTRRYFGLPVAVTEFVQGRGTRYLRLSERAVMDSDPVVVERPYAGGTATVIDEDGFAIREGESTSYLVRLGGPLWALGSEYEVAYTRGYAVDAGPPDIEQLLIDLVGFRLRMKGREGLRSESIGGYSYTRFGEGDLDSIDGAWATIHAWRLPVFA